MAWIAQAVRPGADVAEIGAGTGLFTEPLLGLGTRVTAIEPNTEMRVVLGRRMASAVAAGKLRVTGGTAEHTGLSEGAVDLVAAAQAAHWFAPAEARAEFSRVLRSDGQVLLVWNDWREVANPINVAYGEVVRTFLTPGNEHVETRVPDERIPELLPERWERRVFVNAVEMTRERLHMLALSASYLPGPDSPHADALRDALDVLFVRHEHGGHLTLEYRTVAYLGR
jgi:SAM-dependent methyltransferase